MGITSLPEKKTGFKVWYHRHTRKYSVEIILVTAICLVFVVMLLMRTTARQDQQVPTLMVTPTPAGIPSAGVVLPTTSPQENEKQWVLKRKNGGKEDLIYRFGGYGHEEILRWKNYLLYVYHSGSFEPHKTQVLMHSLASGETEPLYTEDSTYLDISSLTLIDDTLYFSTGAYLAKGATYWIDLAGDKQVHTLVTSRNASVRKIGDQYFLVGGEGDACWGQGDYSLLDPDTKKVTFLATTQEGCAEGEGFVGVSPQKELILAGHKNSDDGPMEITYTYLISVPFADPTHKQGLVSKEAMPKDVKKVIYHEDKDLVVMMGDSVTLFNPADDSLTPGGSFPQEVTSDMEELYYQSETSTSICLQLKGTRYEYNVETKIFGPAKSCPVPTPTPTEQAADNGVHARVAEEFSKLQLPSEYVLRYE